MVQKNQTGFSNNYKGVAVYPIFSEITSTLDYLGLTAALERKVLKVTEIHEGGSVPELRVKILQSALSFSLTEKNWREPNKTGL